MAQDANQLVSAAYQPKDSNTKYQARYRSFHPSDILHIRNPFDEDIHWQVTDDAGNPLIYKIEANGQAELPGGLVATLGLRTIVDKMIQESDDGKEYLNIYNPEVRKKYEDKIIIKFKPAPVSSAVPDVYGNKETVTVNLTSTDEPSKPRATVKAPAPSTPSEAFPSVKKNVDAFAAASAREAAEQAKAGLGKAQVVDE